MLYWVAIKGAVEMPTGDPSEAGPLIFTPERFVDPEEKAIFPEIPISVDLDPTGAFVVNLLRSVVIAGDLWTDIYEDVEDGLVASAPTHYRVSEPAGDAYCIQLDSATPSTLLLTDATRC